ncbi:MAG: TonB-dependent receptor, partial [Aeromicrobium sp.]|nr:TonB-dependent receptor [Burkholderiales bacterium]
MTSPKLRLLCAAIALYCGSTIAQTPAPQPTEPAKAEKSDKDAPPTAKPAAKPAPKTESIEVTSGQVYDERKDDTATKLVVNSAEIMKFGDTQLADVLKRLPGITVQGSSIRMRGLGNGYTQILIDGERAPPGFTIDQLSPTAIERVEILRAATAEFSTQSIAGTINIVLKKKVSLAQREVRAVYAQGSFYKSPSANFVVSDKEGNFSYSVNGYVYGNKNNYPYSSTETGFDAIGNRILFRASSGLSEGTGKGGGIGPRLNWTLKNGDTLTWASFLNFNHGDGNGVFRYDSLVGSPPPTNSVTSRYEYVNDFVRTDLNWITKLAEGAKLDTKLGISVNVSRNNNNSRGFNATNQQNLARSNEGSSRERSATFTGKYSTPIIEGHSLVAGWDTGVSKRKAESRQRDIPFPGVLPAITPINTAEDFDAEIVKLAAFAQDEWNVSKQWSVYLGLRWEGLTTTSEGSSYNTITNRSSVWSPIAQTLFKLPDRKGEQIRLALTRTYKAPNTNSLIPRRFTSIENKPTSPDSQGNPDLRPELATGIDIALEKFWDQGASVSLSAALRRITDYNRQGLRFINNRWVQLPVNDGTANTRSLEFDAKLPLQKFYPTAPGIDFRLNMNRNWSQVDAVPGPNNRLDQQTPFSGTAGLDYRMKNGVVSAGGSYSFRSGGDVRTSVNQIASLTAKRDLDIYALWKVTPKTQLRLTLSNILKPPSVNQNIYFDSFGRTVTSNNTPSKPNVRL